MVKLIKYSLFMMLMLMTTRAMALVNTSTLQGRFKQMDRLCWEIGRTATYPSMCKNPTKVVYRGIMCWGCPEANKCNPMCTGGKVCVNQRCVCPPNQIMYECNGRCVSPTTPCKPQR